MSFIFIFIIMGRWQARQSVRRRDARGEITHNGNFMAQKSNHLLSLLVETVIYCVRLPQITVSFGVDSQT